MEALQGHGILVLRSRRAGLEVQPQRHARGDRRGAARTLRDFPGPPGGDRGTLPGGACRRGRGDVAGGQAGRRACLAPVPDRAGPRPSDDRPEPVHHANCAPRTSARRCTSSPFTGTRTSATALDSGRTTSRSPRRLRRAITLPLFPRMEDRDVDDVCEAVRKIVAPLPPLRLPGGSAGAASPSSVWAPCSEPRRESLAAQVQKPTSVIGSHWLSQ